MSEPSPKLYGCRRGVRMLCPALEAEVIKFKLAYKHEESSDELGEGGNFFDSSYSHS